MSAYGEGTHRFAEDPVAWHNVVTDAYREGKVLLADGKRVRVTVAEDLDDLSVRQRRFLHGPVLGQISDQVRVNGERYVMQVWKEYFRKLFLGERYVSRKVPRWDPKLGRLVVPKKATPHRERVSTEDLNVRQYSEYIEKVISHAATELGVVFELDPIERDGVRYVKKVGKRQPAREGVPA